MNSEDDQKTVKPYGHWPSDLTAEYLSGGTVSISEVLVNESTGDIYWIESRPQEDGRCTIMERSAQGGGVREILPSQYSAAATVIDMGGASFALCPSGSIIFSDDHTQNVIKLDPHSTETSIILKADDGIRYADYSVHPLQPDHIVAAKEDHREADPLNMAYSVKNTLIAIDASTGKEQTLVSGDDFYAYPRFNGDGTRLAWIQWTHPDMPWTGSTLWTADWVDGKLENVACVAGERLKESVSQPKWAPDGTLYFVSDKSGYWQLWKCNSETGRAEALKIEGLEESEFAIADWQLGSSTYVFLDSEFIVAACVAQATSKLLLINTTTQKYTDPELPFVDLSDSSRGVFRVSDSSVVVLGSTRTSPKSITLITNIRSATPNLTNLQDQAAIPLKPKSISLGRYLEAPRTSRPGVVPVFYFPPQNAQYRGPHDVLPPTLIKVHGGPNACSSPALDLTFQYWTSRGFAVCSVNYSGSSGFGRAFREELTGNWGLYDVQDTNDAVSYLKTKNLIHPERVGIYGGSAGGYLTLSAIHMFPSTFQAAVSSYGISDIKALQADSYKYESHDVERLILSSANDSAGRERLYKERSPRYHVKSITAPLLLLQGDIDKAVPKEQSFVMVEEMQKQGRTAEIRVFEGEGHGWVKESTILRALEETEKWWVKYLT